MGEILHGSATTTEAVRRAIGAVAGRVGIGRDAVSGELKLSV